ncbi:MAG: exodeoxyribonuclease V subunit gamma [Magnetococcales bacterium]|nr:exodeoxyribonuclease V subunit gamma [Magnetococcales bacterium]
MNACSPVGITLVHGNRIEALRADLVARMRAEPLAPLENEIILVQSNGMAQWLKLGIAGEGQPGGPPGIAAALELLLPARFLWRVYRAILGAGQVPEASPFDKNRLVWRLMRLVAELAPQDPFAPLRRFLEQDDDLRKRFQLAERLADLLDGYQVYRADWLEAWARQEDVLIDARGNRTPLPQGQAWQAALWRALRQDVHPEVAGGRAEVHAAFLDRAAALPPHPRPAGLPRRVMIFGITTLPRQSLEVLMTLSRWCQVVMYVHNPCQYYWADIVPERELLRSGRGNNRLRQGFPDPLPEALLHLHAHPLLAAWGMQGRDFIALLEEYADDGFVAGLPFPLEVTREERFHAPESPPATLLQQLQDDILELRPLDETRALWPPVDALSDGSIRFHLAHGPQREVEILHDHLLAAFQADPTLTARDILVMVPDINSHAAHIQAVFGLHDPKDPRFIPFVLANQERRPVDPLLCAVERLLALPRSRLTASELIDWLEVPALRQRFAIPAGELPRLRRWIHDSGIRWGLHAAHRQTLGVPTLPDAPDAPNSWQFGLRRMLLGYAVGDRGGPWRDIVPYDEIDPGSADLLGALLGLVEKLATWWQRLSTPVPVAEWCPRLRELLADFFLPEADSGDGYTLAQLENALDPWQEQCAEAGLNEPLPLSVVGEYWLSCLEEGGLTRGFLAGAITFATLMPMRAIPFRYVCLLGMNDGEFPRVGIRTDFDLMRDRYRPGDRSRREDDRYLFLEALLSAREQLYISWAGRSQHDNALSPPSVLVGQLRDHLAAGWQEQRGGSLLERLTVEHRLQPFSVDYFPAHPKPGTPWFTFAHEWRPQTTSPATPAPAPAPLPALPRTRPVTLRELGQFFKDPVKGFYQHRLNLSFDPEETLLEDQEPFALKPLENWQLLDELLHPRQPGRELDPGLERIRLQGALAAGGFGPLQIEALRHPASTLLQRHAEALALWPERLEEDPEIAFGPILDRLTQVRVGADRQHGRVILTASKLGSGRQRRLDKAMLPWIEHLAGQRLGHPMTTLILGQGEAIRFKPLDAETAQTHLRALLAAWESGLCQPLALSVRCGLAWLKNGDGSGEYAKEVENNPYLARAYPDYARLIQDGTFATLAQTLLQPMIEHVDE